MASNRVYTESVVTLNGQQAQAQIDDLKKRASDLNKQLEEIGKKEGPKSKAYKDLKNELDATNKAVKQAEKDIKTYDTVIKNLNGSTLNQLQAALKNLQQRLRATKPDTKEFKEYSKAIKDVRARMRELEGQGKQTQKLFGGFFAKIGWAGLVTGAIATFRKLGKDMIDQTNLIGDKWRNETAGWKAAYNSFVADLASGKGWNEMIERMMRAYKVGKDVEKMLDEMFERNNSLALSESELNLEAEKQRKIMTDVTKSAKERIAAAEEYDRIQKQIAENRKVVAQEEMEAYKLQLQTRTELSDQELDLFIRDYNNNKALIDQAKEYAAKVQEYETKIANTRKAQMYDRDSYSLQTHANIIQSYQDELDEFKRTADESVVYWSEIVAKYDLGNDEMVKNYVQARQKMVDADTNYERATQRSNRQAANLRKQLATDGQNAINKLYQDDIAASDARFKEITNQAKKAYVEGEISEQEYQNRLTEIQRKSLEDKLAIAERHKQSTVEFQTQILDLAVQDKKKLEKMMADLEAAAKKAMDDSMAELDKGVEEFFAEVDKEIEESLKKWEELCERAEEIRRENSPIYAIKEELAEELNDLEELHNNGLLSEEDYQNARIRIIAKYAAKAGDIYGSYLDKTADMVNAIREADEANLEAQMQAELTAAGDNAEKREEIEAKYEQKQLDLKKKYADVDMAINIAKTVANGAVAAVKAVADLGPIAGGIMAAVIAATTVAEVAAIVAQRNAIKNASVSSSGSSGSAQMGQRTVTSGYSEGGYTDRRSNDFQEVGVVHANEWVAPAAMVRANPLIFASLESMRRSGNYRSGVAGFADGGNTSPDSAPAQVNPATGNNELLQQLYDVLEGIRASLPLKAYTVLSETNAKQELEATIKKIVGKG